MCRVTERLSVAGIVDILSRILQEIESFVRGRASQPLSFRQMVVNCLRGILDGHVDVSVLRERERSFELELAVLVHCFRFPFHENRIRLPNGEQ